MDVDASLLSRLQFALQITAPGLAAGLASYLAVLTAMWRITRNGVFRSLRRLWLNIFAIVLVLGLVSGAALIQASGGRAPASIPMTPGAGHMASLAQMALAALLITALLVGAASAWRLLADPEEAESSMGLRMAIGMSAIVAPLLLTVGFPGALQIVVGMGIGMVGLWGAWLSWKSAPEMSRAYLRVAVGMGPAGVVAVVAGWTPWDLRAASPPPTMGPLAVQAVIFGVGLAYILRAIGRGPSPS